MIFKYLLLVIVVCSLQGSRSRSSGRSRQMTGYSENDLELVKKAKIEIENES